RSGLSHDISRKIAQKISTDVGLCSRLHKASLRSVSAVGTGEAASASCRDRPEVLRATPRRRRLSPLTEIVIRLLIPGEAREEIGVEHPATHAPVANTLCPRLGANEPRVINKFTRANHTRVAPLATRLKTGWRRLLRLLNGMAYAAIKQRSNGH